MACEVSCCRFLADDAPGWADRLKLAVVRMVTENRRHSAMRQTAGTLEMSQSAKLLEKVKTVSLFYGKSQTDFVADPKPQGLRRTCTRGFAFLRAAPTGRSWALTVALTCSSR